MENVLAGGARLRPGAPRRTWMRRRIPVRASSRIRSAPRSPLPASTRPALLPFTNPTSSSRTSTTRLLRPTPVAPLELLNPECTHEGFFPVPAPAFLEDPSPFDDPMSLGGCPAEKDSRTNREDPLPRRFVSIFPPLPTPAYRCPENPGVIFLGVPRRGASTVSGCTWREGGARRGCSTLIMSGRRARSSGMRGARERQYPSTWWPWGGRGCLLTVFCRGRASSRNDSCLRPACPGRS